MTAAIVSSLVLASLFSVELPDHPQPWEKTAAAEIESYLTKVVRDSFTVEGQANPVFHVGETDFARAKGLDAAKTEDQRWVVKSFGRDVVVLGGGTQGTLFATGHLLEDIFDIHWWSRDEEYVPAAKPVALAKLDLGGMPCFLQRGVMGSYMHKEPKGNWQSTRLGVLNRMTRGRDDKTADFGSGPYWGPPSSCHTFGYYINWDELKKTHPEYFSLVGGQRKGGIISGQLCLSNPDLPDIMYTKLLEYILLGDAKADKLGLPRPRLYDLSMNDAQTPCQCANCLKEYAQWGESGQLVRFLNAIAARLKKIRPEIILTTLAYHYTETAPKGGVKVADNVAIRLCDTHSSMAGSILDKNNPALRNNILAWNKVAKNLMIWDYSICYSFSQATEPISFPVASERHFADLARFMRDHGVMGYYSEHENDTVGDFWELKRFLLQKLLENPDADDKALTALFMDRYYGKAAKLLTWYREELDRLRVERNGFVNWEPGLPGFNWIEDADIVRFQKMFDEAEALVRDDAQILDRVRHARSGLDQLVLRRSDLRLIVHNAKVAAPDALAERARVKRDFAAWFGPNGRVKVRGFGYDDGLSKSFLSVTNEPAAPAKALPCPDRFKGRVCYDFYPSMMHQSRTYRAAWVTNDVASSSGEALLLEGAFDNEKKLKLPFFGAFHNPSGIGAHGEQLPIGTYPMEPGYHWYKFFDGEYPLCDWLYFGRGWFCGSRMNSLALLTGKKVEGWLELNFLGPDYIPGSTDPNCVRIGRLVFVEK